MYITITFFNVVLKNTIEIFIVFVLNIFDVKPISDRYWFNAALTSVHD